MGPFCWHHAVLAVLLYWTQSISLVCLIFPHWGSDGRPDLCNPLTTGLIDVPKGAQTLVPSDYWSYWLPEGRLDPRCPSDYWLYWLSKGRPDPSSRSGFCLVSFAVLFRRNCCWILRTGRYLWIAVWSYQLGFQGRLWWDESVELVHFAVVTCWNARRRDTFSRIFPIFGTCTFEVWRVYCGIGDWPKSIMSAIELSAGSCWSLFSV